MIELSKRIKELRIEKNLKQKEVAAVLNIAPNTLSQFETGIAKPSLEVLCAMADFFECSLDYLVGRENDFGVINAETKLSPKEQLLLKYFKKTTEDEKDKIIEDCEFFANKKLK